MLLHSALERLSSGHAHWIETGMVTIDAAAMAKDISSTSHVSLDGILFDTDKAEPEAAAAGLDRFVGATREWRGRR